MKRAVLFPFFFVVVATSAAALYYAERRPKTSHVSANPILELAADAQRDVTRVPMHLTRISDEEEISIGRNLSAQYAPINLPLSAQQTALQLYVRRVGNAVAARAHRHLPYDFHLIPDRNLINAFALPGGTVYIGEGMTDLMVTEDQLANVLAHEVEHIDHYHCVERFQLEAKLKHLDLGVVGALLQLPLSVWAAGYHKDEELEADREGMFLAVQAGYSPYGAAEMFERFAKLQKEYVIHAQTPEEELSELAIQSLAGYFRTHPLPSERIEQADRIIAEQNWQKRTDQKPFRLQYEVHNGQSIAH
jgi:beta-barrel assembly-enhancing protease